MKCFVAGQFQVTPNQAVAPVSPTSPERVHLFELIQQEALN